MREQEPFRCIGAASFGPGQTVQEGKSSPARGCLRWAESGSGCGGYERLDLTRRSVGERQRPRPGLRLPVRTRRNRMGFLSDGVLSSISPCGRGYFSFANLSDYEGRLVKSITQRQRQKFRKYGTVPEQILVIAYENGLLPGNASPKGGMKVKRLLTLLGSGPYRDEDNKERALWFRDQIIKEWKPKNHRRK